VGVVVLAVQFFGHPMRSAPFAPYGGTAAACSKWPPSTLHMQKALSQINLQLHHVLSDITESSGQGPDEKIL
jgi:hypothetical protein